MKAEKRQIKILLAAVAVGACAYQAGASVITWGAPQDVVGDSDISTQGTLFAAESAGSAATVNGVSFGTMTSSGNIDYGGYEAYQYQGVGTPAGISSDYATLLAGVSWDDTGADLYTITINNLTQGQEYQVQVWASNGWAPGITDTFNDGNGNTLALGTDSLQWGVGTFVADATGSQTITEITSDPANQNPFLNGMQVRAIPEGSSAIMVVIGSAVLFSVRRSRRRG